MTNPLEALQQWWATPQGGSDADTCLESFRATEEFAEIVFETEDDAEARAKWRIEAHGCREVFWLDQPGEPKWFEDHVLLAPYRDPTVWLSFAAPLADPVRFFGAAAKAHERLFEGRVPLDRWLRTKMFDDRFGILAEGPERVIQAYADALKDQGAEVGLSIPAARSEMGGPTAITFGQSHLVADEFRLIRLS